MLRLLVLALGAGAALGADPFTFDTMLRVARISDPQLSPDGRTVAFVVERADLEANTRPRQIYIVPSAGGEARAVTSEGTRNERPRWYARWRSANAVASWLVWWPPCWRCWSSVGGQRGGCNDRRINDG